MLGSTVTAYDASHQGSLVTTTNRVSTGSIMPVRPMPARTFGLPIPKADQNEPSRLDCLPGEPPEGTLLPDAHAAARFEVAPSGLPVDDEVERSLMSLRDHRPLPLTSAGHQTSRIGETSGNGQPVQRRARPC
jgi:hypothetical protein